MLKNTNDIYATPVAATDGLIGHVEDFFFDDQSWVIRYLLVDTGSWLPGRQVLLSPHAFSGFGEDGEILRANLTKEEIQYSPPIEAEQPITRAHERDYFWYYGWPPYWEFDRSWPIGALPVPTPIPMRSAALHEKLDPLEDIYIKSTHAVRGYDIISRDGVLGAMSGFMIDHKSWAIADLVVEAGPWYSEKYILVSHASIKNFGYSNREVSVKLNRKEPQRTVAARKPVPNF